MIDVAQHRGLVHMVAKRYARVTHGKAGLDYDDLVQAGWLGALRGLETYDPSKGAVSTYLMWWIRHHISREFDNRAETVRVPIHAQQTRRKAGEQARAVVHSLNRPGHGHDGEECGDLINLLASPVPEDDRDDLPDTTLEELIASTPELTPNEARVLRGRARDLTLLKIGDELGGLSRERARQLELSAMVKVRRAHGLEVDDDLEARHDRLTGYRSPRLQATPDKAPAPKVEVTGDVERDVARLRGQGRGLRAVGKLLGISHRAVQAIERKLLARLAEALETAA